MFKLRILFNSSKKYRLFNEKLLNNFYYNKSFSSFSYDNGIITYNKNTKTWFIDNSLKKDLIILEKSKQDTNYQNNIINNNNNNKLNIQKRIDKFRKMEMSESHSTEPFIIKN